MRMIHYYIIAAMAFGTDESIEGLNKDRERVDPTTTPSS